MFPGEFEYHAPETIEEALDLLSRHGSNARLLAGGHSLIPMMKLRLSSSQHLVDLKKLKSSLSYIREENGDLAIGALTTHSEVEFSDSLRQKAAPLAEAAGLIGDVQVRNMGTLGGSLAHADPAADQPAPALALEAQLVAQGPGGRRTISADQFFFGFFSTALQQDELLVEVRVAGLGANSGGRLPEIPASRVGIRRLWRRGGGRDRRRRKLRQVPRRGDGDLRRRLPCHRCRVGSGGIRHQRGRHRGGLGACQRRRGALGGLLCRRRLPESVGGRLCEAGSHHGLGARRRVAPPVFPSALSCLLSRDRAQSTPGPFRPILSNAP